MQLATYKAIQLSNNASYLGPNIPTILIMKKVVGVTYIWDGDVWRTYGTALAMTALDGEYWTYDIEPCFAADTNAVLSVECALISPACFTTIDTYTSDTAATNYLYAINTGIFNDTTEAYALSSCQEIINYLKEISIFVTPVTDINDSDASNCTIHYKLLKDYIMPDANNYIDDYLRPACYTPLKMTEANGTKFCRTIVKLAALYCAWRIETRSYPGGGMPSDSPYAISLKTMLDENLDLIVSGATRLKGQRIKAKMRFVNPHIEPYTPKSSSTMPTGTT